MAACEFVFEGVREFSLARIFECGQAFRWRREDDGSYTGTAGERLANIRFSPEDGACGGTVRVGQMSGAQTDGTAFWADYLDLERDYGRIREELNKSGAAMPEITAAGEGLRILNQDFWETLLSFIVSQNNNIPRIKACIDSLCRHFGREAGCFAERTYYTFPEAGTLAALSEADLGVCRLGYRAGYIVRAARRVAGDGGRQWLDSLRALDFRQAERALLSFHGIGPKVAGCILLFGLGKTEGFPVDVWIGRAMHRFFGVAEGDAKAARAYAETHFGQNAGFALQYLFYYMTLNKNN
ncbi:MAG: 8-oxoguanine DNA glycosylase [Clostridiales Family XIII bacterium]|jgi:N-glycosylase/DNA lyase|nr:8-oxoguanine DNA glycosylase [Clostridiales Family XIII bacterium]